EFGVKKIVFSSSAAVYNTKMVPITEDAPCEPLSPYGFTKFMMENTLRHYQQKDGFKWIALRYFNAAGALIEGSLGESHSPESHLIPNTIESLTQGERRKVFGTDYDTRDGTCVRDYISVEDLAQAHILALGLLSDERKAEYINRPYNLGTGRGMTVKEIIVNIAKILGTKPKWFDGGRRPGDTATLVASAQNFIDATCGEWRPQYSNIEDVLTTAIGWFKNRPDEAKEDKPLPEIDEGLLAEKIRQELAQNKVVSCELKEVILSRLKADREVASREALVIVVSCTVVLSAVMRYKLWLQAALGIIRGDASLDVTAGSIAQIAALINAQEPMPALAVNSGSSSVKYKLIDMKDKRVIKEGATQRIGEQDGDARNHFQAVRSILAELPVKPVIVVHRVVHGGEEYIEPTIINKTVIAGIKKCIPMAPLHNPNNLTGILATMKALPGVVQVAYFDTAFHSTIPEEAYIYPLLYELYEKYGVRTYGFHGPSHKWVSRMAAKKLRKPIEEFNGITCHLGNGSSITAIKGGKSIDTSMGLTPLAGVPMGTRCGDIDPAIIWYLRDKTGWSLKKIAKMLNKESGLKGLSGVSNDIRQLKKKIGIEDTDAIYIALAKIEEALKLKQDKKLWQLKENREKWRCALAITVFVDRVAKYIGQYFAILDRCDAIVFTAGIVENNQLIQQMIKNKLSPVIRDNATFMSIPTNEEMMITEDVVQMIDTESKVARLTGNCLVEAIALRDKLSKREVAGIFAGSPVFSKIRGKKMLFKEAFKIMDQKGISFDELYARKTGKDHWHVVFGYEKGSKPLVQVRAVLEAEPEVLKKAEVGISFKEDDEEEVPGEPEDGIHFIPIDDLFSGSGINPHDLNLPPGADIKIKFISDGQLSEPGAEAFKELFDLLRSLGQFFGKLMPGDIQSMPDKVLGEGMKFSGSGMNVSIELLSRNGLVKRLSEYTGENVLEVATWFYHTQRPYPVFDITGEQKAILCLKDALANLQARGFRIGSLGEDIIIKSNKPGYIAIRQSGEVNGHRMWDVSIPASVIDLSGPEADELLGNFPWDSIGEDDLIGLEFDFNSDFKIIPMTTENYMEIMDTIVPLGDNCFVGKFYKATDQSENTVKYESGVAQKILVFLWDKQPEYSLLRLGEKIHFPLRGALQFSVKDYDDKGDLVDIQKWVQNDPEPFLTQAKYRRQIYMLDEERYIICCEKADVLLTRKCSIVLNGEEHHIWHAELTRLSELIPEADRNFLKPLTENDIATIEGNNWLAGEAVLGNQQPELIIIEPESADKKSAEFNFEGLRQLLARAVKLQVTGEKEVGCRVRKLFPGGKMESERIVKLGRFLKERYALDISRLDSLKDGIILIPSVDRGEGFREALLYDWVYFELQKEEVISFSLRRLAKDFNLDKSKVETMLKTPLFSLTQDRNRPGIYWKRKELLKRKVWGAINFQAAKKFSVALYAERFGLPKEEVDLLFYRGFSGLHFKRIGGKEGRYRLAGIDSDSSNHRHAPITYDHRVKDKQYQDVVPTAELPIGLSEKKPVIAGLTRQEESYIASRLPFLVSNPSKAPPLPIYIQFTTDLPTDEESRRKYLFDYSIGYRYYRAFGLSCGFKRVLIKAHPAFKESDEVLSQFLGLEEEQSRLFAQTWFDHEINRHYILGKDDPEAEEASLLWIYRNGEAYCQANFAVFARDNSIFPAGELAQGLVSISRLLYEKIDISSCDIEGLSNYLYEWMQLYTQPRFLWCLPQSADELTFARALGFTTAVALEEVFSAVAGGVTGHTELVHTHTLTFTEPVKLGWQTFSKLVFITADNTADRLFNNIVIDTQTDAGKLKSVRDFIISGRAEALGLVMVIPDRPCLEIFADKLSETGLFDKSLLTDIFVSGEEKDALDDERRQEEEAQEKSEQIETAFIELAKTMLEQKNPEAAQELIEVNLGRKPQNPDARVVLAQAKWAIRAKRRTKVGEPEEVREKTVDEQIEELRNKLRFADAVLGIFEMSSDLHELLRKSRSRIRIFRRRRDERITKTEAKVKEAKEGIHAAAMRLAGLLIQKNDLKGAERTITKYSGLVSEDTKAKTMLGRIKKLTKVQKRQQARLAAQAEEGPEEKWDEAEAETEIRKLMAENKLDEASEVVEKAQEEFSNPVFRELSDEITKKARRWDPLWLPASQRKELVNLGKDFSESMVQCTSTRNVRKKRRLWSEMAPLVRRLAGRICNLPDNAWERVREIAISEAENMRKDGYSVAEVPEDSKGLRDVINYVSSSSLSPSKAALPGTGGTRLTGIFADSSLVLERDMSTRNLMLCFAGGVDIVYSDRVFSLKGIERSRYLLMEDEGEPIDSLRKTFKKQWVIAEKAKDIVAARWALIEVLKQFIKQGICPPVICRLGEHFPSFALLDAFTQLGAMPMLTPKELAEKLCSNPIYRKEVVSIPPNGEKAIRVVMADNGLFKGPVTPVSVLYLYPYLYPSDSQDFDAMLKNWDKTLDTLGRSQWLGENSFYVGGIDYGWGNREDLQKLVDTVFNATGDELLLSIFEQSRDDSSFRHKRFLEHAIKDIGEHRESLRQIASGLWRKQEPFIENVRGGKIQAPEVAETSMDALSRYFLCITTYFDECDELYPINQYTQNAARSFVKAVLEPDFIDIYTSLSQLTVLSNKMFTRKILEDRISKLPISADDYDEIWGMLVRTKHILSDWRQRHGKNVDTVHAPFSVLAAQDKDVPQGEIPQQRKSLRRLWHDKMWILTTIFSTAIKKKRIVHDEIFLGLADDGRHVESVSHLAVYPAIGFEPFIEMSGLIELIRTKEAINSVEVVPGTSKYPPLLLINLNKEAGWKFSLRGLKQSVKVPAGEEARLRIVLFEAGQAVTDEAPYEELRRDFLFQYLLAWGETKLESALTNGRARPVCPYFLVDGKQLYDAITEGVGQDWITDEFKDAMSKKARKAGRKPLLFNQAIERAYEDTHVAEVLKKVNQWRSDDTLYTLNQALRRLKSAQEELEIPEKQEVLNSQKQIISRRIERHNLVAQVESAIQSGKLGDKNRVLQRLERHFLGEKRPQEVTEPDMQKATGDDKQAFSAWRRLKNSISEQSTKIEERRELLGQVELAIGAKDFKGARGKIDDLIAHSGSGADTDKLLAQINREESEELKRLEQEQMAAFAAAVVEDARRRLNSLLAQAEKLVDIGRLKQAQKRIDDAKKIEFHAPGLARLQARINGIREQRRRDWEEKKHREFLEQLEARERERKLSEFRKEKEELLRQTRDGLKSIVLDDELREFVIREKESPYSTSRQDTLNFKEAVEAAIDDLAKIGPQLYDLAQLLKSDERLEELRKQKESLVSDLEEEFTEKAAVFAFAHVVILAGELHHIGEIQRELFIIEQNADSIIEDLSLGGHSQRRYKFRDPLRLSDGETRQLSAEEVCVGVGFVLSELLKRLEQIEKQYENNAKLADLLSRHLDEDFKERAGGFEREISRRNSSLKTQKRRIDVLSRVGSQMITLPNIPMTPDEFRKLPIHGNIQAEINSLDDGSPAGQKLSQILTKHWKDAAGTVGMYARPRRPTVAKRKKKKERPEPEKAESAGEALREAPAEKQQPLKKAASKRKPTSVNKFRKDLDSAKSLPEILSIIVKAEHIVVNISDYDISTVQQSSYIELVQFAYERFFGFARFLLRLASGIQAVVKLKEQVGTIEEESTLLGGQKSRVTDFIKSADTKIAQLKKTKGKQKDKRPKGGKGFAITELTLGLVIAILVILCFILPGKTDLALATASVTMPFFLAKQGAKTEGYGPSTVNLKLAVKRNNARIRKMIAAGLAYNQAARWRKLKVEENIQMPSGFWTNETTARNMIYATLDTIYGFRRARGRKDIKRMAQLYRKHVIPYKPQDRKKFPECGQLTFFYERGGLRTLLIKPRIFLTKLGSPAAVLRFALPGLIDLTNPDALDPLEVERDYWNDGENARYHTLQALDKIPGFKEAREEKEGGNIKKMAALYRKHVLHYKPLAFFYEVGGLKGLTGRPRKYLENKKENPAALIRFVIDGLIDDDNPDALKSWEVEKKSGRARKSSGFSLSKTLWLIIGIGMVSLSAILLSVYTRERSQFLKTFGYVAGFGTFLGLSVVMGKRIKSWELSSKGGLSEKTG
ncbi:MAG: acetate/propionate family kinase, partial [Deltaproteobacteria bacterium]|nr:acetate/propionate family kinase [Deltaproteobacteria bacterium]